MEEVLDEPIYKANEMHTVTAMLKRFLTLAAGILLGVLLSAAALRLAPAWSIFPNRELNRSADYVRDVLKLVNENYVDQGNVTYERLTREAIHGLVETLDPHSEYLEAADFALFEDDLDGNFGGIGVQVEMREGKVVVIAPMAGTPGERAGILRGDQIESVDGKLLDSDIGIDGVVKLLRGKPGSTVTVGLNRPGPATKHQFTLVRAVINQQSVRRTELLDGHVGYIQLADFSARTGEEFGAALDDLLRQGADSLVLDLRNNPGGLLQAAVEVVEPFFPENELVVYTLGRPAEEREDYLAGLGGEPLTLPIAVLINAGSASAAEVVTGALKDTKRAVVVGERSFGKGSVQSIFNLKNGDGLRLTTARYYTPSGVSIHEKGITPHVELVMTPEEDNRLRIQRLRHDIRDPAEFEQRFGFAPIEDRQLQTALAVLRGAELLKRRGNLAGRSKQ